jgi:hypothetical protein
MAKIVAAHSTTGNLTLTNGYLRVEAVLLRKRYTQVGAAKQREEKWIVDMALYASKADSELVDLLTIPLARGSMVLPYDKNKNPVTEAYKDIASLTMPGWVFDTLTNHADIDD